MRHLVNFGLLFAFLALATTGALDAAVLPQEALFVAGGAPPAAAPPGSGVIGRLAAASIMGDEIDPSVAAERVQDITTRGAARDYLHEVSSRALEVSST